MQNTTNQLLQLISEGKIGGKRGMEMMKKKIDLLSNPRNYIRLEMQYR